MSKRRILVVDDDPVIRRLLHTPLYDAGYEIFEMEDGHAALRWMLQNRADLMVLDVSMPDMDGIQLAHAVKQQHARLPILAISAGEQIMSKEFCLKFMQSLGATEVLPKPFDLADFMKAVKRILAANTCPARPAA